MFRQILIPLLVSFMLLCATTAGFSQESSSHFHLLKDPLLLPERSYVLLSHADKPIFIPQKLCFPIQKEEAPKPIFCRMEDRLHKRFKIWLILRAGSDTEYRELIALPEH